MNPRGVITRPLPVHDPRLPLAVVQVCVYVGGRFLCTLGGGWSVARG